MRTIRRGGEMVGGAVQASAEARGEMACVRLRFQASAACSPELSRRIEALGARVESFPARAVLQTEEAPVRRPRYLVAGWACRYRHLSDGRKQIFDLVLPGEGVSVCLRPHPIAYASTAALTPVRLADAGPLLEPDALEACGELVPALQAQADDGERRLLAQVVRLGRLTALERLAHVFSDLRERLNVVGLVQSDRFEVPLTQETMADMAGLSVVHVNRTLQELRRQNLVRSERGWVHIPDPAALARMAEYGGAG